jgi:hypothetical protein
MSISLRKVVVAAGFAGGSRREDLFGGVGVPGVGAFAHEERDDEFVDGWVVEGRGAFAAEEDGDGDAPDALAGDAPVGAGGDHVGDAFFAPGGVPVTVLISSRARWRKVVWPRGFAPLEICSPLRSAPIGGSVHGDEPLLGGAGDDGVVAAPAVGVGVLEVGGGEECALFFQQLDDDGVGFEDGEAFVGLGMVVASVRPVFIWRPASSTYWTSGRL